MAKGLLINLDRCSGCDSCIVACKLENGLDLGHFYNKVISIGPVGTFPNVEKYWLPSQCQQCKNPACVEVCPTAASYRDPKTGYVLINKEKCIGCKYCMYACPYGVRSFDKEHGCVEKCTLCSQITADGSDVPACVHNCNCGARFFGDLTTLIPTCAERWRNILLRRSMRCPILGTPNRLRATFCRRRWQAGRSWCKWRFNGLWCCFPC